MNKAFKYRLKPNKQQEILIQKTFGCCRFIYNKMLGDKIAYYQETKLSLKNTPAQYKSEFEWLKEVDSYALCNEQMHLQSAYNNFFKNPKTGFPKFKSKKFDKKSYTTNNVNGIIRIGSDNVPHLPRIGNIRFIEHRRIPVEVFPIEKDMTDAELSQLLAEKLNDKSQVVNIMFLFLPNTNIKFQITK